MATKLYREAIREALIEELDRNPRMFLMGEDITWDGKQARIFDVGEVGPYQGQFNLWGVAARRANGTPCRNCPNRNNPGNCN